MFRLTHAQRRWIDQASEAERGAFLTRGPAHTSQAINSGTLDLGVAPMVRGLVVGDAVPDGEQGLALAKDFLDEVRRQYKPIPLEDEIRLGIDGSAWQQMEACDDHQLRIENVLHLGSLLATDAFEGSPDEPAQEFMDHLADRDLPRHPSLEAIGLLPQEFECEPGDDDSIEEVLVQRWHDEGVCGFALKVATPIRRFDEPGRGSYLSWGYVQLGWVYGETFDQAFQAALDWVDRAVERHKLESMATA